MPGEKVLLIGNCIVDDVLTLPHYPTEDDELRALDRCRSLGGNACNSAQILAQLGHDVSLLSSLAGDEAGNWIRDKLASAGISVSFSTIHADATTPLSTIWLNRTNGSRTIVHHRQLPELTLATLRGIDPKRYRWIHVEGRNIDTLAEFLPWLATFPVPLSLELEKPRPGIERLCAFVNTVIISAHYVKIRNTSIDACLHEIRTINPSARIVATQGKMGLTGIDEDGRIVHFGAAPVHQVVDTLGAGDCFIAALISASLQQADFATALEFANRIAARKIQRQGMNID